MRVSVKDYLWNDGQSVKPKFRVVVEAITDQTNDIILLFIYNNQWFQNANIEETAARLYEGKVIKWRYIPPKQRENTPEGK